MLNADAENTKRDAELRAQYVVVPPSDEAKPISCPICETLRSEFLEDNGYDENWVWKNAVVKDERVHLLSSPRLSTRYDIGTGRQSVLPTWSLLIFEDQTTSNYLSF